MSRGLLVVGASVLLAWWAEPSETRAQSTIEPATVAPVIVVADTPLPGTAIDADKIAGEVQTLSVPDLDRDRRTVVLANLAASQLASISLDDEQGSPFQPGLVFRGFEASPISGIAEGLAVYQDGVRLNEAFGDSVNWDLVPEFAVSNFTVQSDNPVFGLNALGGAVTLQMKDGLTFGGHQSEVSGGSFGDIAANAEYGQRIGDFGLYAGVGGLHDDGFRYQSPTTLRHAYGDLAYAHGPVTLHLSVSAALSDIAAAGPTPVQMLAVDPKAVFTQPQSMRNQMEMVHLRGEYRASDRLTFSANAYYRGFDQRLTDGNTTDVTYCANVPAQLCLQGADLFPADALHDPRGRTVPASALPPGATPGEIDFTHTRTNSVGGALQAALSRPIAGRANSFVVGATLDHDATTYAAEGELAWLKPNLDAIGSGVIIDQATSATAQPPLEAPVSLEADNSYVGIYAIDVLDLTRRLSLTLSGRWNIADVRLRDEIGDTLDSDHSFSRFNPGAGLTYRLTRGATAYGGYSEANRAPTPGELSCANPASPCLLDAFLVSDPNLKQVVSHTLEAGLRGRFAAKTLPGAFTWNVSAYRTDSDDDILLLATQINGFGYFRNAGTTRRQGLDANLAYADTHWRLSASYAYLGATFRDREVLSSNSPAADPAGLIYVRPGNRLPMNPASRVALSVGYQVTSSWSVGADVRAQSGQYLVGDQSNQDPKLPGFTTVNLRTSYRLGPHLLLFGDIDNLLDARYYTYGAFTDLAGLPPNYKLTNPRTYSPAQGIALTIGARFRR